MAQDKFPVKDVLASIDLNGKGVWKELSDEERKSVGFWLLNRYGQLLRLMKTKINISTQLVLVKKMDIHN